MDIQEAREKAKVFIEQHNQSAPLPERYLYVLSEASRDLGTVWYFDFYIVQKDGEPRASFGRPQGRSHIHKTVRCGRIFRYKLGGTRGLYYLLPAWMSNDGTIIEDDGNRITFR